MESSLFKCPYCPSEYNSYTGVSLHARKTHNSTAAQLQVDYFYNGEWPTCACGCGEELEFGTATPSKFAKYKNNHHQKTKGGFWTKEGLEKSAQTRRERFAAGEIVSYNKGKKESELYSEAIIAKRLAANKSEARREKISKALKGKEKSPEQKKRLAEISREYWSDPSHTKISRIEREFEEILKTLQLEYVAQYPLLTYKYDFYIGSNLLIEVDGDYWHCNESLGYMSVGKGQQRTKKYDKIKNKVAADNGYTLLRFWESDIRNNPSQVIKTLLPHLPT